MFRCFIPIFTRNNYIFVKLNIERSKIVKLFKDMGQAETTDIKSIQTVRMEVSEMATVMSYSKYSTSYNEQNRTSNNFKLFINRNVSLDAPSSVISENDYKSSYVIIPKSVKDAHYISLFLNSTVGKSILSSTKDGQIIKGTTNISILKSFPIFYAEEFLTECSVLENMLNSLYVGPVPVVKDPVSKKYVDAIHSFLKQVRDAIVLELIIPSLFRDYNVSVLIPWKEEVEKMSPNGSASEDALLDFFDSIINQDNKLVESMNKMRILTKNFIDFLNENPNYANTEVENHKD